MSQSHRFKGAGFRLFRSGASCGREELFNFCLFNFQDLFTYTRSCITLWTEGRGETKIGLLYSFNKMNKLMFYFNFFCRRRVFSLLFSLESFNNTTVELLFNANWRMCRNKQLAGCPTTTSSRTACGFSLDSLRSNWAWTPVSLHILIIAVCWS